MALPPPSIVVPRPVAPTTGASGSGGSIGKKVVWTEEEDAKLRVLVEKFGTKKWSYISTLFDGKGSKQCRRRWQNRLSMDAKNSIWSAEEDRILLKGHKKFGNRWTEIAKLVPGRTDNAVKNRYFALTKKIGNKGTKRGRGATPRGAGGAPPRRNSSGRSGASLGRAPGGNRAGSPTSPLARKGSGRNGSGGIVPHKSDLSIAIPQMMRGPAPKPSEVFSIQLPREGLTEDDLRLIDEVNLLNSPLQIAVKDAMAPAPPGGMGGGGGGGGSGGHGAGTPGGKAALSKLGELMKWIFSDTSPTEDDDDAPGGRARQGGGMGGSAAPTPSTLGPFSLMGSELEAFGSVPETVRSVTRHLISKQFAHIWTPRPNGKEPPTAGQRPATAATAATGPAGGVNGGGAGGGGALAVHSPSLSPYGANGCRRSPRLLQAAKGVLVMPSPKFSDDELEYLLECLSPQAKAA